PLEGGAAGGRCWSVLDRAGQHPFALPAGGQALHAEPVVLTETRGGGEPDSRAPGGVDAEGAGGDLAAVPTDAPELVDRAGHEAHPPHAKVDPRALGAGG